MNLNILFIDDETKIRENLVKIFHNEKIEGHLLFASSAESFEKGIEMVKEFDYDIIILDLYKGEPKEENEKLGLEILKQIQSHAFVPVIFYSGLTKDIDSLASEVVGIVNKGSGVEQLKLEIQRIITSKIALIKGQIYHHIRELLRQYFWDTVHAEKKVFEPIKNDVSIGYLLLRRIANSLSKENIKSLLGDNKIKADKAHPMEFYIYPSGNNEFEAGEILLRDGKYFAVLTPSCDFITEGQRARKVGNVLLAIATPLSQTDLYKKYAANVEKYRQSLSEMIESRKGDRYFFLPGTVFIENLVLDFQNKIMVDYQDLKHYSRIAKLDSPFAQSMVSSFVRYYNRIGFPDLDSDYIISSLK